jgi:LPS export ABC transporter protein LptC
MYIWLMILQKWALIPLFLIGLIVTACEEIEEEKPWLQVERPEMLFTDTTLMDSYDKGVLAWKLKTAYLERWSDKEVVFVRPVLVDIYDSLGERTAFLRADSGRMDLKFTYVYAYGHVYALTPKGASVRSDSLIWNKKDNLVKTESYVRVVSEEGDVLQGRGFESDAHMDNWRILSNVTGIFQDAARRLKEEDKSQAKEIETRDSAQAAPAQSQANAAASSTSAKPNSAQAAPAQPQAKESKPEPAATKDSTAERAPTQSEMELLRKIKNRTNRVKARARDE